MATGNAMQKTWVLTNKIPPTTHTNKQKEYPDNYEKVKQDALNPKSTK